MSPCPSWSAGGCPRFWGPTGRHPVSDPRGPRGQIRPSSSWLGSWCGAPSSTPDLRGFDLGCGSDTGPVRRTCPRKSPSSPPRGTGRVAPGRAAALENYANRVARAGHRLLCRSQVFVQVTGSFEAAVGNFLITARRVLALCRWSLVHLFPPEPVRLQPDSN